MNSYEFIGFFSLSYTYYSLWMKFGNVLYWPYINLAKCNYNQYKLQNWTTIELQPMAYKMQLIDLSSEFELTDFDQLSTDLVLLLSLKATYSIGFHTLLRCPELWLENLGPAILWKKLNIGIFWSWSTSSLNKELPFSVCSYCVLKQVLFIKRNWWS